MIKHCDTYTNVIRYLEVLNVLLFAVYMPIILYFVFFFHNESVEFSMVLGACDNCDEYHNHT